VLSWSMKSVDKYTLPKLDYRGRQGGRTKGPAPRAPPKFLQGFLKDGSCKHILLSWSMKSVDGEDPPKLDYRGRQGGRTKGPAPRAPPKFLQDFLKDGSYKQIVLSWSMKSVDRYTLPKLDYRGRQGGRTKGPAPRALPKFLRGFLKDGSYKQIVLSWSMKSVDGEDPPKAGLSRWPGGS